MNPETNAIGDMPISPRSDRLNFKEKKWYAKTAATSLFRLATMPSSTPIGQTITHADNSTATPVADLDALKQS